MKNEKKFDLMKFDLLALSPVPLCVPLNKNLTQIVSLNKKIVNFRDIKDQNGLFSR
jgi:hypothetical protein